MTAITKTYYNIPFTYSQLALELSGYKAPKNKAQEMEKEGVIVRLKKGWYINSLPMSDYCLGLVANHLHGPSYVSMLTALRTYGLVPEHVYSIQSVALGRSCQFINPLGRFEYTKVSYPYYSIGITIREEGDACYLIATPEKALADLIISTSGLRLRSKKSIIEYLEEDLRFDMEAFEQFNPEIFTLCAQHSKKSQTLDLINSILND